MLQELKSHIFPIIKKHRLIILAYVTILVLAISSSLVLRAFALVYSQHMITDSNQNPFDDLYQRKSWETLNRSWLIFRDNSYWYYTSSTNGITWETPAELYPDGHLTVTASQLDVEFIPYNNTIVTYWASASVNAYTHWYCGSDGVLTWEGANTSPTTSVPAVTNTYVQTIATDKGNLVLGKMSTVAGNTDAYIYTRWNAEGNNSWYWNDGLNHNNMRITITQDWTQTVDIPEDSFYVFCAEGDDTTGTIGYRAFFYDSWAANVELYNEGIITPRALQVVSSQQEGTGEKFGSVYVAFLDGSSIPRLFGYNGTNWGTINSPIGEQTVTDFSLVINKNESTLYFVYSSDNMNHVKIANATEAINPIWDDTGWNYATNPSISSYHEITTPELAYYAKTVVEGANVSVASISIYADEFSVTTYNISFIGLQVLDKWEIGYEEPPESPTLTLNPMFQQWIGTGIFLVGMVMFGIPVIVIAYKGRERTLDIRTLILLFTVILIGFFLLISIGDLI